MESIGRGPVHGSALRHLRRAERYALMVRWCAGVALTLAGLAVVLAVATMMVA